MKTKYTDLLIIYKKNVKAVLFQGNSVEKRKYSANFSFQKLFQIKLFSILLLLTLISIKFFFELIFESASYRVLAQRFS
jgi:hypothetical protein